MLLVVVWAVGPNTVPVRTPPRPVETFPPMCDTAAMGDRPCRTGHGCVIEWETILMSTKPVLAASPPLLTGTDADPPFGRRQGQPGAAATAPKPREHAQRRCYCPPRVDARVARRLGQGGRA